MNITGILHFAKANVKKNISNSITLALLIIVVTGTACLGLTILIQINTLYDRKVDELHSLHFAYAVTRADYDTRYETFFKNDPRIAEYTMQPAVMMPDSHITVGGEIDSFVLFLNADGSDSISGFRPLDSSHVSSDRQTQSHTIYLPFVYSQSGYQPEDDFTVQYKNREFKYKVAGFFESADLAKVNGNLFKYYLPEADFDALKEQMGESVLLMARLHDPNQANQLEEDFREKFDIEVTSLTADSQLFTGYTGYKGTDMMMVSIIGSILVAFSLIATLISLFIIRFRVKNNIEERISHIGILGGAGYTSRQIRLAFVFEYLFIAFPASLAGGVLSILLLPLINSVLLTVTSLFLSAVMQPFLNLGVAVVISILLILMVLLSTRSIHLLPPVIALRGGLNTHNFRRNFMPLHKSYMTAHSNIHIHVRLGLKNIFAYNRLYLMVGATIAGVALILICIATMFVNFSLDQNAIIKMAGMETSDVTIRLAPHTDADAMISELESLPEVRKTSMLDMNSAVSAEPSNSDILFAYISNDFSRMEVLNTYEGTLPVWENEVVISETYARVLGKQIGHSIALKKNGIVKEYLITGFFSTFNSSGRVVLMTLDGFRRISPDYRQQSINVYLSNPQEYDLFVNKIGEQFGVVNVISADPTDPYYAAKVRAEEKIAAYLEQFGIDSAEYAVSLRGEIILSGSSSAYRILKITNWSDYLRTQIKGLGSGITSLLMLIILISTVMIALILYMTNKTIIRKRRTDFGILKAGGFQSRQLILQMLISFMPTALAGSILGCVAGALIVNPTLRLILSEVGAGGDLSLPIPPVLILLICLGLFIITMTITALSTLNIRKISVYQLISE